MRLFGVVFIAAGGFFILTGGESVFAHGGGLNAQGCHNVTMTGQCHCHRDKYGRKLSPPVPCESMLQEDKHSEAHFVAIFCLARDGEIEHSLPHRRRADCLTEDHAIEGDFAPKWVEAYFQSKQYARESGKKAGILLILKTEQDEVYIGKLCELIAERQADIDVFAIGHGFAETGDSISCADGKWSVNPNTRVDAGGNTGPGMLPGACGRGCAAVPIFILGARIV